MACDPDIAIPPGARRRVASEVLKLLVAEGAIGERLSASLLAWRHSGFSVHNGRARSRRGYRGPQEARAIHAARAALPGEDDLSPGRGHGRVPLSHAQRAEAQFPVDTRCAMARIALPPYSGPVRTLGAVRRRGLDQGSGRPAP